METVINVITNTLLPKDFQKRNFMGSDFGNCETETIAENIVFIQKHINPNAWTPFTWEQYKNICKHNVDDNEKDVLDALVKGGKPLWNTSCVLEAGYLAENEAGEYIVTDKFLKAIEEFKN